MYDLWAVLYMLGMSIDTKFQLDIGGDHVDIVTYSGVLFTMELYCTPKSQYTTVKHSQQLFEHT
jgi:hypothetical protein